MGVDAYITVKTPTNIYNFKNYFSKEYTRNKFNKFPTLHIQACVKEGFKKPNALTIEIFESIEKDESIEDGICNCDECQDVNILFYYDWMLIEKYFVLKENINLNYYVNEGCNKLYVKIKLEDD